MEKNIFEQIRDGDAKSDIVYKDEYVTAFHDIDPSAPIHILIIPNKKIVTLNDITEEDSIYLSKILIIHVLIFLASLYLLRPLFSKVF